MMYSYAILFLPDSGTCFINFRIVLPRDVNKQTYQPSFVDQNVCDIVCRGDITGDVRARAVSRDKARRAANCIALTIP